MSRNLDFKDETYSEYALAIGRLILVWNDLHMVLSDTFHAVTKIPNGMATDAIWNSITSDRAQREMIKNLVSLSAISYDLRGDLKAQLVWTLNKIVSLEQVRNDVIHAPIMVDQNGAIKAWDELGNQRAKTLSERKIPGAAIHFYDTCLVLRQYLEQLTDEVRRNTNTLPDRPALPNLGEPKYN